MGQTRTSFQVVPCQSMSIRACVYSSPYEDGVFTAHCLELDVIGQGTSIEAALEQLLEATETQIFVSIEDKTLLLSPAPPFVWQRYKQSQKAKRKIPDELLNRVCARANKRLRYESSSVLAERFENIVATKQVMDELAACA